MALTTNWTEVAYVDKTTRTSSKCRFGLFARVVSSSNTTAEYTIELKPVVCASITLFYVGAGSSTTLYANNAEVESGSKSPQYDWASESTTLGGTTYSKTGYLLDACNDSTPTVKLAGSFNEEKTYYVYYTYVGGTSAYGINGTFNLGGNITLGKVTPASYTVSYDANGGSGAPANQTKYAGSTLTLSSTKPTKSSTTSNGYVVSFNANGGSTVSPITAINTTSYTFSSWNTKADGSGTSYQSGASYTSNSALALYAQYTSTMARGSITLPTSSKNGYTLTGWSDGSKTYTGSYTPTANVTLTAIWDMNPPGDLSIFRERMETTTEQIAITTYAYEGIINSLKVLYREKGTSAWLSQDATMGATSWIGNLKSDTDYEIGLSASNAEHTTYLGETQDISKMAYETYSTLMTKPYTPNIVIEELTPFTIKVSGHSGSEPERELTYAFSKDGGSTWTDEQSNNSYTFTGLAEETSYMIGVKAITHPLSVDAVSTSSIGYLGVTTPADQARAKMKVNGKWETSKMYIKKNGEWVKIKKMYIKKNGQWVRTEN